MAVDAGDLEGGYIVVVSHFANTTSLKEIIFRTVKEKGLLF
jgi:hypothetical protein